MDFLASLTLRASVSVFFFFNDTATTEIYTLSLHDALPISLPRRVAPLDAVARDRAGAAVPERGHERRDVRGVVLEVRVEGDEDGSARRAKARSEGRRLSRVPLERDDAQLGMRGPQALELGKRAVGRAVIHRDHFVGRASQRHRDLFEEWGQVVALVVDGDHERELNGAGHT